MPDAETPNLAPPGLTYRFSLDVAVAEPQELGDVGGRRRIVPILGGRLFGPEHSGEVLPGGADWQTLRADGVSLLQARYSVRMDDGQIVGVINTGVRRAAPDVAARLASGETVHPALYYFRATPIFEVGPGPHHWLTGSIFVSVGERLPDRVRLKVFEVG